MKKIFFCFLSTLLFSNSALYTNQAYALEQETEYSEFSEFDELDALFEDPALLEKFVKEHKTDDNQAESFFSFVKRPEWFIAAQEWFDSQVMARYPDEREKILEKLVVLDNYIRTYSHERLNLVTLAPVLIICSSVTVATSLMLCILQCCRSTHAKSPDKIL